MKKSDISTWCPYPWFNLNSNTDGNIKLCCSITDNEHIRDNEHIYNFGRDSIENIWNSSYLKSIREELLSGKKPKACDVCWKLEENNIQSSRRAAVRDKLYEWGNKPAELPTSLELRLGNKCNLKCMTCWSLSSSSIYAEREKAINEVETPLWLKEMWEAEIKTVSSVDQAWFKSKTFKENFKKMAPRLKRLYLTGGEPTLIEENCEFLQTLIDEKNLDCAVSFTTNATLWNEKFYQLISQFNKSEAQVSLDGFGSMNEYVRYPSSWLTIEKNLKKIATLPKKIDIKILSVISLLNIQDITTLLEFLLKSFNSRPYIYSPIVLQAPDFLSANILRSEYRNLAVKKIKYFLANNEERDGIWFKQGLEQILDQLKATPFSENKQRELVLQARDYILTNEKIRNLPHPQKQELFESGLII